MNGNEKPKPSPGIGMNLKLYKKPKPGQPSAEPAEKIDGPLNFLEQVEQESLRAQQKATHTIPTATANKKNAYIALAALMVLLAGLLFYFYYRPAPPELTGSQDRASLLTLCQQGNGVACGEMALLEYHGLNSLEGIPQETTPNPNNAFIYARLACSRDVAFGCYMMWRLWTKKETRLLSPATAEETLAKGCVLGNNICCLLRERTAGKRDIASDELHKTIADAAAGTQPPRYAENDREQRLFTYFIVIEQ